MDSCDENDVSTESFASRDDSESLSFDFASSHGADSSTEEDASNGAIVSEIRLKEEREVFFSWIQENFPKTDTYNNVHNAILTILVSEGAAEPYLNTFRFILSKTKLNLSVKDTIHFNTVDKALAERSDLYGRIDGLDEGTQITYIARPFDSCQSMPVVLYDSSSCALPISFFEVLTRHAETAGFLAISAKRGCATDPNVIIQIAIPNVRNQHEVENEDVRRHVQRILARAGQTPREQTADWVGNWVEEPWTMEDDMAANGGEVWQFEAAVYLIKIKCGDYFPNIALHGILDSPRVVKVLFDSEKVLEVLSSLPSIERIFPVIDLQLLAGLDDLPRSADYAGATGDSALGWLGTAASLSEAATWYGVVPEDDLMFKPYFQELNAISSLAKKAPSESSNGKKLGAKSAPGLTTEAILSKPLSRTALSEEAAIILNLFNALVHFDAPVQFAAKISQANADNLMGYPDPSRSLRDWAVEASKAAAKDEAELAEENGGRRDGVSASPAVNRTPTSWLSNVIEETMIRAASRSEEYRVGAPQRVRA